MEQNVSYFVIADSTGTEAFGELAESVERVSEQLRALGNVHCVPLFIDSQDAERYTALCRFQGIVDAVSRWSGPGERMKYILSHLEGAGYDTVSVYRPAATEPETHPIGAFNS